MRSQFLKATQARLQQISEDIGFGLMLPDTTTRNTPYLNAVMAGTGTIGGLLLNNPVVIGMGAVASLLIVTDSYARGKALRLQ